MTTTSRVSYARRIVRVSAIIGVLSSAVVLGPSACGFPDPVLLDLSTSEGGSSGSTSSGGQQQDAPIDRRLPDGGLAPIDGDPGVDVNPCPTKPNPCDCDEDGFLATRCGGNDCDDLDPRKRPEAGFSTEIPPTGSTADWNCSGVVDKKDPTGFDACSGLPPARCGDAGGFMFDPGCGMKGRFMQCAFFPTPQPRCEGVQDENHTLGCN